MKTKKFRPKLKQPKAKVLKSLNALDAGIAAQADKPKKERKVFQQYRGEVDAKGQVHLVPTGNVRPKDWAFKTKPEGRPSLIMPKKVDVPLKRQLWTQRVLRDTFINHQINMGSGENRWFVLFDTPSRKVTAQDQLDLLLADESTRYFVRVNMGKKWIIIENKDGSEV